MEEAMSRKLVLLALACASLPLAGCANGRYTYGGGLAWHSYPYDVWYDGYYGPLYDGYWGTDGFFWFRLNSTAHYRKGDHSHFYRGTMPPSQRFRRFDGNTRQPPQGTRLPHYPPPGSRDGRRDRDHAPPRR
jgi:hypothetical protein